MRDFWKVIVGTRSKHGMINTVWLLWSPTWVACLLTTNITGFVASFFIGQQRNIGMFHAGIW
jgi:hypothetical protein